MYTSCFNDELCTSYMTHTNFIIDTTVICSYNTLRLKKPHKTPKGTEQCYGWKVKRAIVTLITAGKWKFHIFPDTKNPANFPRPFPDFLLSRRLFPDSFWIPRWIQVSGFSGKSGGNSDTNEDRCQPVNDGRQCCRSQKMRYNPRPSVRYRRLDVSDNGVPENSWKTN